jgi:serine phosphatase RsbU (regulator of sigma subunit)
MDAPLTGHIVRTNELLEHDFVISDPTHAGFKDSLMDLFQKTGAYLILPVIHEETFLGLITLDRKTNLKPYSDMDKRFLDELTVGIRFAIINARVFDTQRELLEKEKEARHVQEELLRVKDNMNRELESKVEERTRELNLTLEKMRSANEHIMESLRYSRILQKSMLPAPSRTREFLPKSFFIWKPRDIVGGDTYYCERFESGVIVVLIDCTGHGVPGAFMTMLANSGVQRIVGEEHVLEPSKILKRLNHMIKTSLQQNRGDSKSDDGLDAAVCYFDFKTRELSFAASRLSLFIVDNSELLTISGDAHSLGYVSSDLSFEFTTHRIPDPDLSKTFYLTTDGFIDQLGGEPRRRFGTRRFKQLITDNHRRDFDAQKIFFLQRLDEHRGENTATDDVTVAGFTFAGT